EHNQDRCELLSLSMELNHCCFFLCIRLATDLISSPFLLLARRPRRSTLFPYTTLFRSAPETPAWFRRNGCDGGGCYGSSCWGNRSEEHTSELQSRENLVCRLLLEKKKECLKLAPGEEIGIDDLVGVSAQHEGIQSVSAH